MTIRYHPLKRGYMVTSPFGWRDFDKAVHTGIDFGKEGGSSDLPVYAIQGGTVIFAGAASGYGGPDPAGWLVIDSDDSQGSGVFEYGHIVRLAHIGLGTKVAAGQQIGTINPNRDTNGGASPHLHVSYMPYEYAPSKKQDWKALLNGAQFPGDAAPVPTPGPAQPEEGDDMSDASDVRVQLRGPGDNGWTELAPQPDEAGNRFSWFKKKNVTAQTLVEAVGTLVFEATLRIDAAGRGVADYRKRKGDTVAGNAASSAKMISELHDKFDALAAEVKSLKKG